MNLSPLYTYRHVLISHVKATDFAHRVGDLRPVNHLLLVIKIYGHRIVQIIQDQRLMSMEADIS